MVRLLYALTEPETLALSNPRTYGNDIVAAGPWVRGSCELAHRVVLRVERSTFVVHLQVIDVDLGHAFYTHGNYYPCPLEINHGDSLTDAWTRFEDRVRRSLDMESRPVPITLDSEDD